MELFARRDGLFNARNERIRLKGVNWFGLETNIFTLHGLWSVSLDALFEFLQTHRFNALRLPLSIAFVDQMEQNKEIPSGGIDTFQNPTLTRINARELLDLVFAKCKQFGLLVVLDLHVEQASGAIEPLWYTSTCSEERWIDAWQKLVTRYRTQPHFLGCDLKNEPHGGATWNQNTPATDWAKAAERIALAIHQVNPKLLIFVEGIENPDRGSSVSSFWGGILSDVHEYPIKLSVPDKLVYSPHVYGPSVHMQSYFSDPEFPRNMPAIWTQQFGFLKTTDCYSDGSEGSTNGAALVVGEWGGKMEPGSLDEIWQNAFGDWLASHEIDSFYWALNCNSGDTKGLVQDDWKTPEEHKLQLLAKIYPNPTVFSFETHCRELPSTLQSPNKGPVEPPPSSSSCYSPPFLALSSPPPPPAFEDASLSRSKSSVVKSQMANVSLESKAVNSWDDWTQMECELVNASNMTRVDPLVIQLPKDSIIINCWNVQHVGDTFVMESSLEPGQTHGFGFVCKGHVPEMTLQ